MSDIRIRAEHLEPFIQSVFENAGLSPEDAAIEAEVLIWANLRGVDSHGVLRVITYLDNIKTGAMNPQPDIRVVKESPAVAHIACDRALGPVATVPAMKKAIEKAKNVGIGWVLLSNVTHQGAMAYYSLMAAQEGFAGIAIVCSPPNMAPFGAKAAGVHNSPIAVAVPGNKRDPISLDMATSVAAGGKLQLAQDKGVPLGEDWALDAAGNPTTDARKGVILRPAGGPKGSGLALIFQCLSSLMVNNPLLVPVLRGGENSRNQNSIVAAIDISFFIDLDDYKDHVDNLIDELKALPRADGFDDILMPGEPENRTLAQRSAEGIPLPEGTAEKLREAAIKNWSRYVRDCNH
ncbi:MAG: Ldh family oxidoreductase [Candidatus Latescibacteria bacterium]|nr:Ldh family oxidoreductase [Candidatus Latescibacterota bacterium]